jgi:hypothetical protein
MKKLILSIIVIVFFVSCSSSKKGCEIRDISGVKTDQELKVLKVFGFDWMKKALVCRMGEFEVASPAESTGDNIDILFVFKKGKPVFYRQGGSTWIYSPKLQDAAFDKVMVNIEHGGDNDNITRFWYKTIGKDTEVQIDDTNYDGQPDWRIVWKGHEIKEVYKWENSRWQLKEMSAKKP